MLVHQLPKTDYTFKESLAAATNIAYNCEHTKAHENCVRNDCGLAKNYIALYNAVKEHHVPHCGHCDLCELLKNEIYNRG